MTIASGVSKQLVFARQSALGTKATAGGTSQALRRVTSTVDLQKGTYQSNEIRPSMQVSDYRHGVRSVSGTINGEMSVGTYQKFLESLVRQNVLTAATTGAVITISAALTSGATGTLTRSSGSYITDGFRVGMVVRCTGWTTTATTINAVNMLITALTATVMTVVILNGTAMVTKAAGDSVTVLEAGKHTFTPTTAQTRDYYTIEHYYADLDLSEQFSDCVISQAAITLPATGMSTVDFSVMGLDMQATSVSGAPYFTSVTAATSGSVLAAASGALYVAGTAVGLITGLNFNINGNYTTIGGVVGSNVEPDIFPGRVTCDGQATVLFQDATMRDYFINETEVSLVAAFTTGTAGTADFVAFTMPRIKFGGSTKDDGEKGLVMTMPFVALENPAGVAGTYPGTITIQDSQFV